MGPRHAVKGFLKVNSANVKLHSPGAGPLGEGPQDEAVVYRLVAGAEAGLAAGTPGRGLQPSRQPGVEHEGVELAKDMAYSDTAVVLGVSSVSLFEDRGDGAHAGGNRPARNRALNKRARTGSNTTLPALISAAFSGPRQALEGLSLERAPSTSASAMSASSSASTGGGSLRAPGPRGAGGRWA